MAKIKKIKNSNNELRHIGVLLEHVDEKVGLVAEQYVDIKDEIGGIKGEISSIKKTLDSHTGMIGKLAVDMEIVKTDIELIKHSFKKKVDIDEFAALERRVLLLEKRR